MNCHSFLCTSFDRVLRRHFIKKREDAWDPSSQECSLCSLERKKVPSLATVKPVDMDLPPSDSLNIGLLKQTAEEKVRIWKLNGKVWSGRLSLEAYLGREEYLSNQKLTRDGSITFWVLTYLTKKPNQRPILSSRESKEAGFGQEARSRG